tara:strand:+ start:113 stop:295 length:183 start_codon:yes stop_codon:yes gene_type:complete
VGFATSINPGNKIGIYETIITAVCIVLDIVSLPVIIKYRFGAEKNKPKTAIEKRVLILPI